jgi:hypothetical protein
MEPGHYMNEAESAAPQVWQEFSPRDGGLARIHERLLGASGSWCWRTRG